MWHAEPFSSTSAVNGKHRFIIGGLFLCHGLLRAGLGFSILSASMEYNFSSVMIAFAMAVPSLFGGYNLLTGNSSAHTILPIAALVNLFDFPMGVFLSVYYYWYWKYACDSPNPFKSKPGVEQETLTSL